MEQKLYTPEGFKALQDELDDIVNVKIEENKKEISKARAYGDLSENSEYDAAKQEQAILHARADELREMIANAKVIDESQIDHSRISVGSVVKVKVKGSKEEKEYTLVSTNEVDFWSGKISDQSPIGAALIGAREGDTVTVASPNGEFQLKIVSVARAKG